MSKDILIGAYKILRKMGAEQYEIQPETSFTKDLFFDETDRTCLLYFMETRFNIEISDIEANKMDTVNDMLNLVSKHREAQLN